MFLHKNLKFMKLDQQTLHLVHYTKKTNIYKIPLKKAAPKNETAFTTPPNECVLQATLWHALQLIYENAPFHDLLERLLAL